MRDDESTAACVGIPIVRTKLLAYGTGAAFGGISGAFFASYLGVVNAGQFEFSFSIFIFAMVVLGGLGSIPGVVVGAIVLSVLNNYLLPDVLFDLPSKLGLDFDLSAISSGIYGAILVVVMLLRPKGSCRRRAHRSAVDAAGLVGPRRQLDPVPGAELGLEAGEVGLHRAEGDVQLGADLGVGAAPGDRRPGPPPPARSAARPAGAGGAAARGAGEVARAAAR